MSRAPGRPIRVIVADTQPKRVGRLLEGQPDMEVVGEAHDLQEIFRGVRTSNPDVLLLDLAFPEGDGITLMERLREECPMLRVLVVTLLDTPACLRSVLAAGGKGYLLKTAPAADLLEAIRAVARGWTYVKLTPQTGVEEAAAQPVY